MNNTVIPLSKAPIGKKVIVSGLTSDGASRRRMLDLGIIAGTEIEPLYKSPSGNTTAYMIRGAVIALRADLSYKIMVSMS
ncbi:MAG: ferrous iron transport protein A [Clostridiales bacterium]|nr:ferrous iron transport protein A [Clostridiales bacterium]